MVISDEDPQVVDVVALQNQVRELLARVSELEAKFKAKDEATEAAESTNKEEKPGAGSDEEPKPPWHVRLVTNRRDRASKTGERKDFEEEKSQETKNDSPQEAAIIRIFIYDSKDNEDETENRGQLEIFNKDLLELLKRVLSHHPTHEFYGECVTLDSPFEPLVLNWDRLKTEADKEGSTENDKTARRALGMVLDRVRQNAGDSRLNDFLRSREAVIRSNNITYDTLWTIFAPGTIIYGRPFLNQDQLFIVKDNSGPWPNSDSKEWELECWTYDWNGRDFRRRFLRLAFPTFNGSKPITALLYFPLSMAEDRDRIESRLIERGRRYRKYCTANAGERRFKYQGRAIVDRVGFLLGLDSDSDDAHALSKEALVNSDVMVDFESYYQHGPQEGYVGAIPIYELSYECTCTRCNGNRDLARTYHRAFDETAEEDEKEWVDLQYMLLPPRVLGYILRDKRWAQLEIDNLQPVSDNGNAFEKRLHLKGDASLNGQETKQLLLNLVTTHGQDQLADLVADKGQGLVILLYGKPGVGKTSTGRVDLYMCPVSDLPHHRIELTVVSAETLAAAAGKPLFSIGVGDVGTQAENVESNLHRIFDLATRWKAILLIDEVDVFVQSRGMGHQGPTTERNALVSVFLRVLEYYQGILILTTNQIALFDVAVQSRIHIAIKYTDLEKEQAIQIFESFLDQYKIKGAVEDYERIKKTFRSDIAKKGFDGRQLRNIVSSAMGQAMARKDGTGKLTEEDVNIIVSNVDSFKSDLEYQMMRYLDLQTGRPGY
ncbi:P-loop containing nucleoside triphosphate hydrolase protein [Eremomyces bilateralis CBS 781.70]|uniref:P-loop containing nucleoside triphosphate hydrolase protein n=1 Tax=Eremomyces bilateralis CBS 781.70 TaxID=1392243 RepID=A0A6G1GDE7_9PEZI|nr:P-loop containing nucleoside triphosphate hydrolase protein [Eremomyces bilateralis CBS 781.70]KAF1816127.1 P-loop containing nucleoside triphosphate hydrolase protein [Eremomyces bilateralis CBS 781.70]